MSAPALTLAYSSGEAMPITTLPEPLTPPDADLTAFEWAEFNSHRMQRSDLWIDSTGDEFKAWFALWMYAQHEKPAGTLPNNERRLSRTVAMAGVSDWQSVKAMALHGWVLCSDDRYHHPVVAEAVKRAWDRRLDYLSQVEDAKHRKQVEREKRRAMIEAIRKAGGKAEWNETTTSLTAKFEALQTCHAPVTVTGDDLSQTCHAPVTPKTETETETVNINNTPLTPQVGNPVGSQQPTPPSPFAKPQPRAPIAEIVELYNQLPLMNKASWPSDPTLRDIDRLWATDLKTIEAWRNYFALMEKSDWFMGRARDAQGKPFTATLATLCKPATVKKMLAGEYPVTPSTSLPDHANLGADYFKNFGCSAPDEDLPTEEETAALLAEIAENDKKFKAQRAALGV